MRDDNGRFVAGNTGGPGNPYARRVARLRSLLLEAVSEEDLRELIRALIGQAKSGDLAAIREVLDRCLGKTGRIEQADPDRVDLNEVLLAKDRAQQARSLGAKGDVNYAEDSRSEPEKMAAFLNEVECLARQWESLELPVSELLKKLRRLMPDDVLHERSASA